MNSIAKGAITEGSRQGHGVVLSIRDSEEQTLKLTVLRSANI